MAAIDTLITALGTSRIDAVYVRAGVAQSGGNLTSWTDHRGSSGFGPTLQPNGGLGGTAPTVDANGYVVTDGSASFVANSAASAKFKRAGTPRTVVVWGTYVGNPSAWWSLVDSLTSPTETYGFGASSNRPNILGAQAAALLPSVVPLAQVPLAVIVSNNGPYTGANGFTNSPQNAGEVTLRGEVIGRGPGSSVPRTEDVGAVLVATDPTYNSGTTTGFLSLGRVGSNYGAMKIGGVLVMNKAMTIADRAAIETFLLADGVSLYDRSDARPVLAVFGSSIDAGAKATTYTSAGFATPPVTTDTTWPAHLQRLLNLASTAVDVVPWGMGGCNLNKLAAVVSGNTTSWQADALAFVLSPARLAQGYKNLVHLGHGTNDFYNQSLTDAQLYDLFYTWSQLVAANSGVPLLGTTIPRQNYTGTMETYRQAFNAYLVNGTFPSGRAQLPASRQVVNYTARNDSGTFPFANQASASNSTYYDDGTHLADDGTSSKKGYVNMAQQVLAVATAASLFARTTPAYQQYAAQTIDGTKVTAAQTNFPVPFRIQANELRTIANGGVVTVTNGVPDIALFADAALTQPIPFERTGYAPTTGLFTGYVLISALASPANTPYYIAAGNSGVVTDQAQPTAVWDSNYVFVGHGGDGGSVNVLDSTSYANHLSNAGATATTDPVDGATTFNGTSQYADRTGAPTDGTGGVTLEVYAKPAATVSSARHLLAVSSDVSTSQAYGIQANAGNVVRAQTTNQQAISAGSAIASGVWFYASATFAADGSTRSISVNGVTPVVESTAATGVPTPDNMSLGCIRIQGSPILRAQYWNGDIGETRVSKVIRSTTWRSTTDASVRGIATFSSTSAFSAVPLSGSTVSGVTLSPPSASVQVSATTALTATVQGTGSPSQAVTFASSDPNIATVDAYGTVTGVAAGAVTITATSVQNGAFSATSAITVAASGAVVTGVAIAPPSASVAAGATAALSATVLGTGSPSQAVTWSSSAAAVATVNGSGVVTGVSAGTASIRATSVADPSKFAEVTVNVATAAVLSAATRRRLPTALGDASAARELESALGGSALTVIPTVSSAIRSSSATDGVGYAAGAGAAVTQPTSRTTGVTVNAICGAITTNAASLAAGAEATFTVTNSAVQLGDVVVLATRGGQTPGTSVAYVSAVANGSFDVTLTNQHASTADTGASVLNFAIVRAVAA